jgi:diguanylate cyclase (GGDEF)-like protein
LSVSSPEAFAFSPTDELLARLLANCCVPPIQRHRLEHLAVTDDLTLALNSRALVPRLLEEMARAERTDAPLSIAMLDLDHFKRVNDTYGHAVGDRVLRAFAERVRVDTRLVDVLVRYGGEEFVLIMPHTDAVQASVIAERLRKHAAHEPLAVTRAHDREGILQTASIGVVTWNGRESPKALVRRADRAMYEAKRRGRNAVVVGERAGATSSEPARRRPSRRASQMPSRRSSRGRPSRT